MNFTDAHEAMLADPNHEHYEKVKMMKAFESFIEALQKFDSCGSHAHIDFVHENLCSGSIDVTAPGIGSAFAIYAKHFALTQEF